MILERLPSAYKLRWMMHAQKPYCPSANRRHSHSTQYGWSGFYPFRMKRKGVPSLAPSCLSMKSDMSKDPPQNFSIGHFPLTPRMKLEGASTPAPSHMSIKSDMSKDPPQNFRSGNSPLTPRMVLERPSAYKLRWRMHTQKPYCPSANRMKRKGVPSLAPSCLSMKSDMSKDPPQNFSIGHFPLTPRMKLEGAPSPAFIYLSMKSDMSMDPPISFRSEHSPFMSRSPSPQWPLNLNLGIRGRCEIPVLDRCLLTEDHFQCSECTKVLKDPVSIPCGHSYCRHCITSYWAQPSHAGHYACPQCSHTYSSCPALYPNSALAEVVQKLQQFSPVLPALSYAGPGDVACDFCTGKKLRAVKFCLTCSASYCESHVRQHYTVPVLQRHTLVEPQHQHQDSKPKEQSGIMTEDSNQLSGCKRKKLKQLHDMNDGVLKHVNDVQTQTDQPQQMQQTSEGTGKLLDDTPCFQDNDHSQEQMPEKQGKVSEDICMDIVMPEKNSTRSLIQPHLQALREKLNCQYEWHDLLKKKKQQQMKRKQEQPQKQEQLKKLRQK